MSTGTSDVPASGDFTNGAIPNVGSNSGNFSTGMGPIDPNQGLNSLGGPLMGANAGTLPNGFATGGGASSNYTTPQGQGTGGGSGISSGALNGNTSFTMPNNSMPQLNSQKLQQGMAVGAKLAGGNTQQQPMQGRNSSVRLQATNFGMPSTDFAGSNSGSQAGQSLLQLLAKYRPGSQ